MTAYGGGMSETAAAQGGDDVMVDWDVARATAFRLLRPGPDVTVEEAREAVAELREFATKAEEHVRAYTGLHAAGGRAPVLVVDRKGWVQANLDAFRGVLRPLTTKLAAKRGAPVSSPLASVGPRLTGVEAGALLAFLSTKVLGQFDPFWADAASVPSPRTSAELDGGSAGEPGPSVNGPGAVGRLLLVAPNVVHVERELEVNPRDFRLWVCLHEETHRVQFTAVPWLRDHLRGEIESFLNHTDLDPTVMLSQLRQVVEQVGRIGRGDEEVSILDLLQTPAQREILDRLTAVMSLLEGHADVVMDGVGPEVVPSVATIRERFQRRRGGGSWLDQFLKRILGLDAKLRQYRDGAAFVRAVVADVGQEGFNQVWASPDHLPTRGEITNPRAWVRRVHG
ncbi:putative hydrolase/coenzyme F420 biosynthesis associated uncharacterized protein [Thermasporomyces composti]|jgi:coenzyme F420 biosynthesis associated uncharacterized protein|uniref:Putative hydrolase/coenzyme F420 biosynthesis associated uncharacterized protein n=2 Tax=Thermasporomyces composti TaxID=696763 RepID=A0A3D9V5E4_THECX|nr:putative hydrolase/coenzyme F420 biosynthesis associated uncharacterized protein [Thermasporomyces composti]